MQVHEEQGRRQEQQVQVHEEQGVLLGEQAGGRASRVVAMRLF